MPDAKIERIKLRILQLDSRIKWKANATCNNINELVRAAKMNLDAGKDQTVALMPVKSFHDWVSYAFVYTRLINRDRPEDEPELLDIIRTAIIYNNLYLFTDHRIPV